MVLQGFELSLLTTSGSRLSEKLSGAATWTDPSAGQDPGLDALPLEPPSSPRRSHLTYFRYPRTTPGSAPWPQLGLLVLTEPAPRRPASGSLHTSAFDRSEHSVSPRLVPSRSGVCCCPVERRSASSGDLATRRRLIPSPRGAPTSTSEEPCVSPLQLAYLLIPDFAPAQGLQRPAMRRLAPRRQVRRVPSQDLTPRRARCISLYDGLNRRRRDPGPQFQGSSNVSVSRRWENLSGNGLPPMPHEALDDASTGSLPRRPPSARVPGTCQRQWDTLRD